jgi:rubredoxin
MRCGFCNYEFDPKHAETVCRGCLLSGNCQLIRCPRCGYEMQQEAKLIGWWRKWRHKNRPAKIRE